MLMTKNRLLSGYTIVDLSQRLPGPLATSILSSLGAEVIKLEISHKPDAFDSNFYKKNELIFSLWYRELNKNKKIKKVDLKEDRQEIIEILSRADAIITGESFHWKDILDDDQIKEVPQIIVAGGKGKHKFLHDLNALALTNAFFLYAHNQKEDALSPPYLPFAGICFGQQIATETLACIASKTKISKPHHIYLDETSQFIFNHFWNDDIQALGRTRFLHNGLFPCYNLYPTKDGHYVALAAVEDKFWLNLVDIFGISLKLEDRFDKSGRVFKILEELFKKLTINEIQSQIGNAEVCLTFVD